jgi:glycosyltransferase involved in cell wall biosynthesis
MTPVLISIVIPAHRAVRYLDETLASVRAQTWSHWEILVCEDGIFDDTAAHVNAFALTTANRVRLFQNQTNRGVSHARNLLLDAVTGEYVAFLDADDLWTPDHLAYSIGLVVAAGADWIIGGLNLIDPEGHLLAADILPPVLPSGEIPTRLLQHNFILTSSIVARVAVFADGLRFDPSLTIGEDLDLCIQILRRGFQPTFSRHATLNYRKHLASTTANAVRFPEEFSRVFEKYLGNAAVDQTICRAGLRDLLSTVARMTWRREPERALKALDRLADVSALSLRNHAYRILALLSRRRSTA